MADNLLSLRQPILYAELVWRNQRLWILMLCLAGLVLTPVSMFAYRGHFSVNSGAFLVYLPLGLLYGAAILYYRQRSAVEVTEDGVKVSKLLRSVVIGYDLIRNVRVQKLETQFPEQRRRLLPPMMRSLTTKDALFLRLRAEDARMAEVRRVLGSRFVYEDMLAVPIPDPAAMSWEITSRLPERTSVNMGGQRRRKRSRAR